MTTVLYNKQTNKWEKILPEERDKLTQEELDRVLVMPQKLLDKLDFSIKQQKRNNDVVVIVEGKEGSGKSSLAGNIMRYVTGDKFNPEVQMIGANYDEALEKIDNCKEKDAIMFDEGNAFFMSTETMKREQRDLHKVFSIFRQLNLFVVICLPSFFRLGTYFALDRSHMVLRTYIKNGERGYFAYYGEKLKNNYYRKGRADGHNVNIVQPKFRARFTQCITLENPEYKEFKLKTLKKELAKAKQQAPKKHKSTTEIKSELIDDAIKRNPDYTNTAIAEILGVSEGTIRRRKKLITDYK